MCSYSTGCIALIPPRLNCLCTIQHKVNNHSLLLMPLSIWQAFASFLFLCSWSTSRSNRPNVTSFPGCSQIFLLSQGLFKDRAHLSTFKIFIFAKFSWFIVLVVFLVIVQSSELVSVWFCKKMTFYPNFFSNHIFAIYVGGASLGLPTACRLIAVSGARLPSVTEAEWRIYASIN